MNYRIRNIVLALTLGVLAAAIALVYASRAGTQSTASGAQVVVLVASHDITIGTAGADLAKAGRVKSVSVSRTDLAPDAVTDLSTLDRLVATQTTYAGEQLSSRRFGAAGAQGLRAGLKGSLRIVEVAGDPHQLLSGTLRDGDRVDVVASIRKPEVGQTHYSQIVLRNLLVVGPPSGDSTSSAGGKDDFSVRLQLTDAQEQRLFWVQKNADWSLVLRPVVDPANTAAASATAESILGGSNGR